MNRLCVAWRRPGAGTARISDAPVSAAPDSGAAALGGEDGGEEQAQERGGGSLGNLMLLPVQRGVARNAQHLGVLRATHPQKLKARAGFFGRERRGVELLQGVQDVLSRCVLKYRGALGVRSGALGALPDELIERSRGAA